ncbi:MAG: hypothetical protein LBC12_03795 [Nitrososphaerota archaeon]|nr:hypothetical protein [Nitrososphaerota archaeon]
MKTQVVVNRVDGQIICASSAKGRRHDSRLFKESKLKIDSKIRAVMDTGYVGIAKFHANSVIPVKCSEKRPLVMEDKVFNRRVSGERVLNEQVISLMKRFEIVSDRYCNCRKRFSLRFNLICGICNFEKMTVSQEVYYFRTVP